MVSLSSKSLLASESYCAGFETEKWRCSPFAFHLAEWLPDYALFEEELLIHAGNSLAKLNQAAVRVYTSAKYAKRGEVGEIALHAVCREHFGTIPISPRVFYKSASNDVIKAFDLVHARLLPNEPVEIWFGESKLYKDRADAIADAIASIRTHLDAGFLSNEKLLLGPQIPKGTPRYDEIASLFHKNTSLDELVGSAVFVVGILGDSEAASSAKSICDEYKGNLEAELSTLAKRLSDAKFAANIRLVLIYIPLVGKEQLVEAFDKRLKGLQ